jgi:transposase InsO family protein
MTVMVDAFRELYNHVRPHEALGGDRPDRALPRRPRQRSVRRTQRTTPNAPNRADSLTRHKIEVAPRAGIAVYVLGETGKLAAARTHDDVNRPTGRGR